jgi:hypothetical protein
MARASSRRIEAAVDGRDMEPGPRLHESESGLQILLREGVL